MKCILRTILVALVVVLFAPAALAEEAKAGAAKAKPAAKPATLVTMTPDELKWVPNPANADVMMAVVWGDPAKGPHGAFHKFKPGFTAALHTHSADMQRRGRLGDDDRGDGGRAGEEAPARLLRVPAPHGEARDEVRHRERVRHLRSGEREVRPRAGGGEEEEGGA